MFLNKKNLFKENDPGVSPADEAKRIHQSRQRFEKIHLRRGSSEVGQEVVGTVGNRIEHDVL